jgi:hypothetical protein
MTQSGYRKFLINETARLGTLKTKALYPPNAEDGRGFEDAVIGYILQKDYVRRIMSDPVFAEDAYEKYGIGDTAQ